MTNEPELPRSIDALYADLQPQLWRMLTTNLQVSDALLEDACQSAWSLLLLFHESVQAGYELGWLSTTATREALRMHRAQLESQSLERVAGPVRLDRYRVAEPEPERALEIRERLAEIKQLPPRQRRVVWLHGLGYEYVEIAAATGDSRRTVERQLMHARKRLTALQQSA